MAVKRKKSNMKGITIGRGMKRPTKKGAGMTKKGVAKYRRQNPGSKLQTAVTERNLQVREHLDVNHIVLDQQVK